MRFLANENFPKPSVDLLRKAGHEVVSIAETNSGVSDTAVLSKAVEEQLIILTFDRGYGELLFRYRLEWSPAVVYFRTKGQTPYDAASLLLKLLKDERFEIVNKFTVVDTESIRQRQL
ncbi:hypothetical protein GCM10023187_41700 [Nibrella viscosa]|uniref:DUF5615 domain-containing protein n=1 Tax=Nibrella viscosa TaxID=1084524 RepID=A0ABP8KR39_9BACT